MQAMEPIFDRHGKAVAFRHRDYIYDPGGAAVGIIHRRAVFAFDGECRGFFEDSFYRDRAGRPIGFEQGATGGPKLPFTERNVIAPPPYELPRLPAIDGVPAPPAMRSNLWAEADWQGFLPRGAAPQP